MSDDSDDIDDLDRYRAAMRRWLAENLPRREGAALRSAHAVEPEALAAGRALQKATYEAGYLGITVPVEYGGQGLSRAHQRIWNEESARYAVPLPGGIASSVTLGIVLPTVLVHGSEAQKREWVPRMLAGDEIWVQLLSEPGAGSDLAGLLTRATRDGDTWVLNGGTGQGTLSLTLSVDGIAHSDSTLPIPTAWASAPVRTSGSATAPWAQPPGRRPCGPR